MISLPFLASLFGYGVVIHSGLTMLTAVCYVASPVLFGGLWCRLPIVMFGRVRHVNCGCVANSATPRQLCVDRALAPPMWIGLRVSALFVEYLVPKYFYWSRECVRCAWAHDTGMDHEGQVSLLLL